MLDRHAIMSMSRAQQNRLTMGKIGRIIYVPALWSVVPSTSIAVSRKAGFYMSSEASMGTPRRKNILGNRYGKLVAIEFDHIASNKEACWKCRCDCGRAHIVRQSCLRKGLTTSCGCAKRHSDLAKFHSIAEGRILPPGVRGFNTLYAAYQRRAKYKQWEFGITGEEFKTLVTSECYYCGAVPAQVYKVRSNHGGEFIYNGIDRLDNSLGYISGNVVPACGFCNCAKSTYGLDDFFSKLRAIVEREDRRNNP